MENELDNDLANDLVVELDNEHVVELDKDLDNDPTPTDPMENDLDSNIYLMFHHTFIWKQWNQFCTMGWIILIGSVTSLVSQSEKTDLFMFI